MRRRRRQPPRVIASMKRPLTGAREVGGATSARLLTASENERNGA